MNNQCLPMIEFFNFFYIIIVSENSGGEVVNRINAF
jgi:hypothetical protein